MTKVQETPVMSLCHVVRHACSGMELALKRAEKANDAGDRAVAVARSLEIYHWCSQIESSVRLFCVGGGEMTVNQVKDLKERIKGHEALKRIMYLDHLGNPTIGWGHKLTEPISEKACEAIFADDFANAIKGFFSLPVNVRCHLTLPRREVLVEMIFQLGLTRFMKFREMLKALAAKDYERAADEIMDSAAVKVQGLGKRFGEYADMMRRG